MLLSQTLHHPVLIDISRLDSLPPPQEAITPRIPSLPPVPLFFGVPHLKLEEHDTLSAVISPESEPHCSTSSTIPASGPLAEQPGPPTRLSLQRGTIDPVTIAVVDAIDKPLIFNPSKPPRRQANGDMGVARAHRSFIFWYVISQEKVTSRKEVE